jgi:ankyrin repeat protein
MGIGYLGTSIIGCFLLTALCPAEEKMTATADEAAQRAAIGGKYRVLLHKIHAPGDTGKYSGEDLHDYGWWAGESYAGQNNLQFGYWVWVDPHWYVFSECHLLVADALVSEETVGELPVPEGASPLHWAVENGMIRTVAELIAAKNDVNATDDDGQTALHIAAYNGHAPITKLLIEHDADVNARGPSGQTPLHAAAEVGSTTVAALLLAAKADAAPADNSNYTPLHAAAWNNHPQTAMLLLHHDAPVDARTDDAETPLHKAAWRGHVKVALVLLSHGADRHAKDNFDLTPLDKANSDIERLTHKQPVAKLLAED